MKAIRTVYRAHLSAKYPARYVAKDGDNNRIIVPVSEIEQELGDSKWSPERYHRFAAQKLCDKMGWKGEFVTGFFDVEAYHVFLNREQSAAPELLAALQMIVHGFDLSPIDGMETDIEVARAAIAKATGVSLSN